MKLRSHLAVALAALALAGAPTAFALPATTYGDNFDSYSSGAAPGAFKKGGTSNATWSISAPGTNRQFRNVITNPSGIGGGVSSSTREVPYIGGLHKKNFTISTTMRVVSGGSSYTIGLMAFAAAHPYNTTSGPFYWFCLDHNGTIRIRTSWDATSSNLTLGTATNLPGPIAIGTTYTFTVVGTYSGNTLTMAFTAVGGGNTASLTATSTAPHAGVSFGYQNRASAAGSSLTVDVDDFLVSVPMTFNQVWQDEFNGTALDTTVWSKGYRFADVINNELQAFRPENVVVGNGLLTLHTTQKRGQINHAGTYAIGTTTIAVDGFTEAIPANTSIRIGEKVPNESDDRTYVVASSVGGSTPTQLTLTTGLRHAVADNTRVIITAKNYDANNYQWGKFDYSSGAVTTYNKWTKTYGYFEASIKMNHNHKGTWPAFWLMPDRGPTYTNLNQRVAVGDVVGGVSVPMGAEIDIVEYMNAWKNPTTGLSLMHSGLIWAYGTTGNATGDYGLANDGFGPDLYYANAETAFHKYGVYWEPGIVTFYLDDKVILTRQRADKVPVCPEYMILNASLTTNDWHGNVIPIADIDAGAPSKMEIDYVRVFDVTPGGSGGGGGGSREPVADTYVRDGSYASTNYGTTTALTVKNDVATYNRESFVRFSTTGLGSTPNIRLRMVPIGMGADPVTLQFQLVTSDTWTETGTTWNNRPAGSTVLATNAGPFTVNQPFEVDVTAQAQAAANSDGLLSIKILSTVNGSNRVIDLGSKEHATAGYRPVLVW